MGEISNGTALVLRVLPSCVGLLQYRPAENGSGTVFMGAGVQILLDMKHKV